MAGFESETIKVLAETGAYFFVLTRKGSLRGGGRYGTVTAATVFAWVTSKHAVCVSARKQSPRVLRDAVRVLPQAVTYGHVLFGSLAGLKGRVPQGTQ